MNFNSLVSMLPYAICAILAFGVLVLGHELGHFVLAKINNVKVEEFAIGMGPKLVGIQGKETLYSIRILPIGGYVKMLGEQEASKDERAFNNKSPVQKLSIVAAGPIMNFLMAILFFAIVVLSVGGYSTLTVENPVEGYPAQKAGILSGDTIKAINNKKVSMIQEFKTELIKGEGKTVKVDVDRNGETKSFNITPSKGEEKRDYNIGVSLKAVKNPTVFQALNRGVKNVNYVVKETFGFFKTLFHGKVKKEDVGGPVSIIKISVAQAKAGVINLLYFIALMSVQLAIFNIIPFPALDGGYIFINLFEIITRKKISDEKVGVISAIGFVFLMILMVLVTVKDILYPINF